MKLKVNQINKIKSKLIEAKGRRWAEELGRINGCTSDLIRKVFRNEELDRRGIFQDAIDMIHQYEKEKQELIEKL